MQRLRRVGTLLPVVLALLAATPAALGQRVLRERFEGPDRYWVRGRADARFKETAHKITEDLAHSGQACEHIRVLAEPGTFIHYTHDIGQAPVNEDLLVSLWLRSSRPGVRIYCRVVLPHERDPKNAGQPLTVLLPGDVYKLVGRWQQVGVPEPVRRLREQQQLLQADRKREVNVSGAYVDRLVLNVYGGGPGQTDVWTDDLIVGPVLTPRPAPLQVRRPDTDPANARPVTRPATGAVQLRGKHLLVDGERFFMRAIRHTGTPLWVLRQAGFNTVWVDESASAELVKNAADMGFWIVPSIQPPRWEPGHGPTPAMLASRQRFDRTVSRFRDQERILCWDLGSNLVAEGLPDVARTVRAFRTLDPMRPVTADVWDGFGRYTRSIDRLMMGAHRWPLFTGLELTAYRDWLVQRRRLAAPGTFSWTWIQTHLPEWYEASLRDEVLQVSAVEGGQRLSPARLASLGPQPEQIRLLTYTALGAGYRGLGFWSDKALADPHAGRDRLLAMARLNQELKMLAPLLADAQEPEWIDTHDGNIKAAVLRTHRAVLVLPIWMGPGAQFVPGQAANFDLRLKVPQVPQTFQLWEVSPGRVRSYPSRRVVGGTEVRIRNFGLTGALVFTADMKLIAELQNQQYEMGQLAAQMTHDQAREELVKVTQVREALERMGHALPDGAALMREAERHLARSLDHRRNRQHAQAYGEAAVALRALRILMRAHWERAVRYFDVPTASPYAVSFYSLPRHWEFWDRIRTSVPGRNLLPDGDFETPPGEAPRGWLVQEVPTLDPVAVDVRRVRTRAPSGQQALVLSVRPKEGELAPLALERTFVALHSPAVSLPPGTPVRISAWVRIPSDIGASTDGLLIYDSAGGEPLAARLRDKVKWKRISLYRTVPATGKINLTVALTGLGEVYLDDLRIEPLATESLPGEVVERPAPGWTVPAPARTASDYAPRFRTRTTSRPDPGR
jgi:hypothetical protein